MIHWVKIALNFNTPSIRPTIIQVPRGRKWLIWSKLASLSHILKFVDSLSINALSLDWLTFQCKKHPNLVQLREAWRSISVPQLKSKKIQQIKHSPNLLLNKRFKIKWKPHLKITTGYRDAGLTNICETQQRSFLPNVEGGNMPCSIYRAIISHWLVVTLWWTQKNQLSKNSYPLSPPLENVDTKAFHSSPNASTVTSPISRHVPFRQIWKAVDRV
jgi:hypothetical protein